jgi:DNA-directed RNA polymerase subunit RPC12/RpoP/ribosomal protein L37E
MNRKPYIESRIVVIRMAGQCYWNCGTNFETSDRSPALPMDIGFYNKCPRCGTHRYALAGTATMRYACTKCGLAQNINGRLPKWNAYPKFQCSRCNMPMASQDDSDLYKCIKCGRVWDGKYARGNSSGNVVLRCPHCNCGTLYPAS